MTNSAPKFELETASNPQGLRRVAIDTLTRVEGHGKVTLLLDESGQVQQARLHIVEFRGFEKFIQGRPYWEVPVMVQRLCGICPVSHNLAASKAMDQIVGVDQITPTAEGIRRLMHYAQILQSHALHFFHLSLPDLLLGFESDLEKRNILEVALKHPETAKQGILLRKFGQEIIRMTTGKRIHGTGNVPGGVQKSLAIEDLNYLLKDIDSIITWSSGAVEFAKTLFNSLPENYKNFGEHVCGNMSIVSRKNNKNGEFDLYDGNLRITDSNGGIWADNIEPNDYADWISEQVKPWSYMKFPYLKKLGPENGWYRVGPLARVQNCSFMPTELAEKQRKIFINSSVSKTRHQPLSFHWARMIEMLHAAEIIKELLYNPAITSSKDLITSGTRRSEGVGIIEAPRGTLIHHYQVGEDDLVTKCNLIVSTTHNNQAMNESIRSVAKTYLNGQTLTEGLLNHIEVAIRAFDPCLSCATHALGKMPLQIELQDVQGNLIHSLIRE